jgi:hypothetical protein
VGEYHQPISSPSGAAAIPNPLCSPTFGKQSWQTALCKAGAVCQGRGGLDLQARLREHAGHLAERHSKQLMISVRESGCRSSKCCVLDAAQFQARAREESTKPWQVRMSRLHSQAQHGVLAQTMGQRRCLGVALRHPPYRGMRSHFHLARLVRLPYLAAQTCCRAVEVSTPASHRSVERDVSTS